MNTGRDVHTETELRMKSRAIALGLVLFSWHLVCDDQFLTEYIANQCQRNWSQRWHIPIGVGAFTLGDIRKDPDLTKRVHAGSDKQTVVLQNIRLIRALDNWKGKHEALEAAVKTAELDVASQKQTTSLWKRRNELIKTDKVRLQLQIAGLESRCKNFKEGMLQNQRLKSGKLLLERQKKALEKKIETLKIENESLKTQLKR